MLYFFDAVKFIRQASRYFEKIDWFYSYFHHFVKLALTPLIPIFHFFFSAFNVRGTACAFFTYNSWTNPPKKTEFLHFFLTKAFWTECNDL